MSTRNAKADPGASAAPPAPSAASPSAASPSAATPSAASASLLSAEDTQAARHSTARAARASTVLEDYVELIDDLLQQEGEARPTDLARRLGVSHPTAIKSIARLKALGLAHSKPYRSIFLTEEGRALARRVRARHRVVVDLLVAVGVPPDIAESDAEGIEHHVSAATLDAFAGFLRRLPGAAAPGAAATKA